MSLIALMPALTFPSLRLLPVWLLAPLALDAAQAQILLALQAAQADKLSLHEILEFDDE